MDISPDPRKTAAWDELENHLHQFSAIHLRDLLSQQQSRFSALSVEAWGLFADFSRCRLNEETLP